MVQSIILNLKLLTKTEYSDRQITIENNNIKTINTHYDTNNCNIAFKIFAGFYTKNYF